MNISQDLAQTITFHCAPTLTGIKPASLVSRKNPQGSDLNGEIRQLNDLLNGHGIFVERLCDCTQRNLLLVYRHHLLQRLLQTPRIRQFLQREGYPVSSDLKACIDFLKKRIGASVEFPHEIGLFLGYPVDDVMGFIEHRGQNFRMCGHWKVYSDEARAIGMFEKFNRCREQLCKKLAQGFQFQELLTVS